MERDCNSYYDCCDCGGNDCGCAYCWSCKACDNCKEYHSDDNNSGVNKDCEYHS